MGCNCNAAVNTREMRQVRASICGPCAGDSQVCRYDAQPVSVHIMGHPCPAGKHPGADGLVRWMGIRWRGQPWPLRIWLWTTRYNDRDWDAFKVKIPLCGCIDRLKSLWERWVSASIH